MAESAKNKANAAENNLKHNLKNTLDSVRDLETSYRTVAQFYKNTELDKVDNVSIVNASLEQMKDRIIHCLLMLLQMSLSKTTID